MNLKRGRSYFHSSLLAMATFNAVGPLFGCPFVTGSLPHSPQFVRALTITSPDGERRFVAEGRVAPLLMYLMIGLPLLLPKTLEHIPEAAIDGILAYVGYEGIVATGLWARITLMFTPCGTHAANPSPLALPACCLGPSSPQGAETETASRVAGWTSFPLGTPACGRCACICTRCCSSSCSPSAGGSTSPPSACASPSSSSLWSRCASRPLPPLPTVAPACPPRLSTLRGHHLVMRNPPHAIDHALASA